MSGQRDGAERSSGRDLELHNGADRMHVGDMPGLARVVAVSSVRIGFWAAATGMSAGRRVVDVALHPGHAAELQVEAAAITRASVGKEAEQRLRSAAAHNPVIRVVTDTVESISPSQSNAQPTEPEPVNPLHEAGQNLLRASRDVWSED